MKSTKLKFEPSDFHYIGPHRKDVQIEAANIANLKLDDWLKTHGVVVYGNWAAMSDKIPFHIWDVNQRDSHSVRAILLNIEPLEQAKVETLTEKAKIVIDKLLAMSDAELAERFEKFCAETEVSENEK